MRVPAGHGPSGGEPDRGGHSTMKRDDRQGGTTILPPC